MHIEMAILIFEHFILISSNMKKTNLFSCFLYFFHFAYFFHLNQSLRTTLKVQEILNTRYAFGEVIRVVSIVYIHYICLLESNFDLFPVNSLVKWLIENPCGSSQNIIYACLVTAWFVVSAYFIIQKVPIDQTIRKQI